MLGPFLLLISPAIGSFLAVLADRLPRGEDVVRKPSACRSCKTPLKPRDLLPILSFALSAGRCRQCKAPIPPWLLYMEIIAIGCAILALILGTTPAEIVLYALFLWVLQALVASDLLWFRLPDPLTGALFVIALALAWVTGLPRPEMALWGAVIGVGSFAILRWGYRWIRGREGLGLGDVKLIAGLGAALGPYDLPMMLLVAALTTLAVAAVGRLRSARALSPTRPLPFGAALACATVVIWVAQRMV
ncbi:prepilin peptidase [Roseovarius sp. 2305UL8-3]|uniref:prepilin peptidase n=1 Tax=Roseovarius conchicola TaxID=3121636 RepID=UPI00352771A0